MIVTCTSEFRHSRRVLWESILLFLQRREKNVDPDGGRRLRAGASWPRRGDDSLRGVHEAADSLVLESDSV